MTSSVCEHTPHVCWLVTSRRKSFHAVPEMAPWKERSANVATGLDETTVNAPMHDERSR